MELAQECNNFLLKWPCPPPLVSNIVIGYSFENARAGFVNPCTPNSFLLCS